MPIVKKNQPLEVRRFAISLTIPLVFLFFFWLIKIIESYYGIRFVEYGIFPRDLVSLKGILFTPFIHGDYKHLIGNSISFFVLGTALFYFYPQVATKALFLIYILSHILLWIGGRASWHIGASVLIYGFASFLFISGIIRKYIPLMAISLIIVFLYGSMIWHIFPFQINDPISWEGHLFGAVSGVLAAFVYRKEGPSRPPWTWELDPEEEKDEEQNSLDNPENEEQIFSSENQNSTGHSGFKNSDQ